ncbi:hypothetical protein PC116_g34598, partial [Phytophthora cactorum]
CGEARVDPATPFAADGPEKGQGCGGDEWIELSEVAGRIQYAGEISDAFDATVFDNVQKHIKYLVLTNTWPKFVTEIQARRRSDESERSDRTGESNSSLASRISNLINSIF